jgi:plasmid stabilization system protein ParE
MKLRFDPRAVQDLHDIRDYLVSRASERAAEVVRRHLRTRIERLKSHPLIGIATNNPEIRMLPPTRYPYRIYYTLQNDEVVVLHIRHTARRLPADP